jgi:hypothetical protein
MKALPLILAAIVVPFYLVAACASLGMPQSDCAGNPDLTTRAQVDACRAALSDAGHKDAAHDAAKDVSHE